MDEEDDDVVFDLSERGLLSNHVKPRATVQSRKIKIICTVCLCSAFFGLGLCIAIPGPTLLDLQQRTQSDTEQISRIFTGRSVGYLAGSVVGGILFDRFNQPCLLSFSLLLSALGTAAVPWCNSYLFLMGILAFQGVSMGFLDTGGNVLCLHVWGQRSAPYMQTLHFSFGVGAFVAPLIAEQFLSTDTNVTVNVNATGSGGRKLLSLSTNEKDLANNYLSMFFSSRLPTFQFSRIYHGSQQNTQLHNYHRIKRDTENSLNQTTTPVSSNETHPPWFVDHITNLTRTLQKLSKFEFAYIIIALFNFIVCIMFTALCCCGSQSLLAIRKEDTCPEYERKENRGFRVQILFMLFIFYFLYVGMEVTYGGFIMAFSVVYLRWSKTEGTLLTSVFWGAFAAGRGLAIPLSRWLSPPVMLIINLLLSCMSLGGLLMAVDSSPHAVWLCTALVGVGFSSVFPTGITWAERYMHVTGKATAVFVVGSALGEMCLPVVVGWLFESKGELWLIRILLACALLSVVLYIFMQNLATNNGIRYMRLPVAADELEMDALPVSNHTEVFNPVAETEHNEMSSRSHKKVTFNLSNTPGATTSKKGSILKSSAKQD